MPFLVLPSSISRDYLALKTKIIFQFPTGHSHPSPFWKIAKMAPLEIQIYLFEVTRKWFRNCIQKLSQAPFKCLSKWIKGDKWDCFKNFSQELKKSFCLGFLWMPRETKRQNWIRLCRHLEMAKTLLHIFWNLIFIYIFWFIFSNFFFSDNAIPIKSWFNDPTDTALLNLLPVLDALRFVSDVRSVLSRNREAHRLW